MKKIPTLFQRDSENMKRVLPEVSQGCEWVLAGEGAATRKYDGTCCMFDGTDWWARREVKPGKRSPADFQPIETDPMTGKMVGWEPMAQSAFAKWHADAMEAEHQPSGTDDPNALYAPGTYELCGPKINGNPEGFERHALIGHREADRLENVPTDSRFPFEGLAEYLRAHHYEGIVWHHPEGRMAKLKRRDFS